MTASDNDRLTPTPSLISSNRTPGRIETAFFLSFLARSLACLLVRSSALLHDQACHFQNVVPLVCSQDFSNM